VAGVIFLNFDGETLQGSGNYQDDSKTNTSWVLGLYAGQGSYQYAAYDGSAQQRQAIIDASKQDFAAYSLTLVTERPNTGDYTMAMIGPSNFIGGSVLGVAPVDCADSIRNNVVFAFNGASHQTITAATTIGQEVAHSYGLEHVNNMQDILYPTTGGGGDPTFTDQCNAITGQLMCGSQHQQSCGAQTQQNSHAELLAIFGQSAPDTESPAVNITSPVDGAIFEPGDMFEVTADASDDNEIVVVELYVDGQFHSGLEQLPYAWPVVGIPEGEHEFYAVAKDPAGNETHSPVITVEARTGGDPGTGVGEDGGEGGSGGMDSGGPGGLPPGFGGDDEADVGCGCSTVGDPLHWPVWSLGGLALITLRRRRG
jgi:MYXO-CTERM domain-containing protein